MMEKFILNLDKPRKLKFGFQADELITKKFGEKSFEELHELAVHDVVFFVWAGLVWEDEKLTVEKTRDLLDEKIGEECTQSDFILKTFKALRAHMGFKEKKKRKTQAKKVIPSRRAGRQPSK